MNQSLLEALLGGLFVGLGATLMLLFNGRITGNSGIIARALDFKEGAWRLSYLLGLFFGALLFRFVYPQEVTLTFNPSTVSLIGAGLLVGFGTQLGSGCTSGHGVCGIARLSRRSITATLVFMAAGFVTVFIIRQTGGIWWAKGF